MAVRDVWAPKDKKEIDPKVVREKGEAGDATYWKEQRDAARAKREFEDEERTAKKARDKEDSPPAESPLQVKGSIDLGNFNLQQIQAEMKKQQDDIQTRAQEQIDALDRKANDYRDQVHQIQLKMVEDGMKAQIEMLQKTITDGLTKQKEPGIVEQVNQISQMATILGYKKAEEMEGLPSEVRLKMMEMGINEKQSQRQFEWDKMISERNWQLELKKLEASEAARMAKFQQEKEKRETMIASPIQMLGSAIAQGLLNHEGGNKPSSSPVSKRKRSAHRLQAGEDDSGVVECPECGEPVAIAPKARSAVCSNCEATFTIDRIKNNA